MTTSDVSPLLVIILVVVVLVNLIPCLIFLDYRRRLYRKLQQRRNSDENIQTSPDMFDDEDEVVPESLKSSSEGKGGDEKAESEFGAMENCASKEENARVFVEKQEQALQAASSRWMGRANGYNTVSAVPRDGI